MKIRLKAPKPLSYEAEPKSLGGHLKKRRIESGLFQREVAERIEVTVNTIIDWERDRVEPEIRYWPKIIAFLGFDPSPKPETLGDRLQAKYRQLGLPRKEVARRLGMDEGTLQRYEMGIWEPSGDKTRRLITSFLEEG